MSDTGVGIEPGKLALIFEPFVQADSSTSRRYGGTGLGLTICHRLVTLMGGDCGVTSQLGEGSTFWFTVAVSADRVRKGDDPEPLGGVLALDDRARMEGALASSRLLLAEDNLINQKVALSMLSDAGCHIDVVETGAAAVRAVEAHRYDAILMDCQMPELNGFEATAAIRAHEIDSDRRTPIIGITAGARREDRERCMAGGMDGYLAKPVRKDVLLVAVGRAIGAGDCLQHMDSGALLGDRDRAGGSAHRSGLGPGAQHEELRTAGELAGAAGSDDAVPDGRVPNVTAVPEGAEGPAAERPDAPPRVLVVDDDEVSQDVTVLMLDHLGVRADVAGNGVEALDALVTATYDVVLMDIQMPEMDGLEASRRIRSDTKVDPQPVIIALTASGTPEEQRKFAQSGVDQYLAKPIRLELLAAALTAAG